MLKYQSLCQDQSCKVSRFSSAAARLLPGLVGHTAAFWLPDTPWLLVRQMMTDLLLRFAKALRDIVEYSQGSGGCSNGEIGCLRDMATLLVDLVEERQALPP